MSDLNTEVGSADGDPIAVVSVPANTPAVITPREAGRILASQRHKTKEANVAVGTTALDVTETGVSSAAIGAEQESTAPAEDTSPETATGETQEAEAAEQPPIEPPRSWKAEEKERFNALPRETQEYLAERETERDRLLNRSQSEAAEKLKGLTAKEQVVEQARQNYESALPQLLEMLQTSQQGEFSDIRSIADVERLSREDWPRYSQWDFAQKKIALVQQQMQAAQQRQSQEKLQQFSEFASKEDKLFIERVPDMADTEKALRLQKQAMAVLKDIGFSETELGQSWNGDKDLSLRDHRVQLLIRDATLYREAQAKAKAAQAKPVPPVQRPGAAQGRNADAEAEIQALTRQLDNASGVNALRIATRLTEAKRAAAAR